MDARSCARVLTLERGGDGATRIELLRTQPHVKFLAQHVKEEPGVPGRNRTPPVTVNVLLDTDSGGTKILEELLMKMKRASTKTQLAVPFKGAARVRTAFGGKCAVAD